ncbi:hypothetical protein PMAYCL1PPCAC_17032, partial [Pristionchus mayeri]
FPMYPLLFLLLPSTLAVTCFDSITGGTCCGDYCYAYRENGKSKIEETGCMIGEIYRSVNGKCLDESEKSYCYCDSDLCNNPNADYPNWKQGKLKCGKERNCIACDRFHFDDTLYDDCRLEEGTIFARLMQPQSCARFQAGKLSNGNNELVTCVCDKGDNCGKKLLEFQKLDSKKVTCLMGSGGVDTCKGDFCFIIGSEYISLRKRGCITNNETLFAGLFKIGYFIDRGEEHIICQSKNCNQNWEVAKQSVIINEPVCSTTTVTTSTTSTTTKSTSESIEEYFRRRWNSLIYSWTNVFNDVMLRLEG